MTQHTHQQIVKQIDEIECEIYSLYQKLTRLRLDLQGQWRVTPSQGDRPEHYRSGEYK